MLTPKREDVAADGVGSPRNIGLCSGVGIGGIPRSFEGFMPGVSGSDLYRRLLVPAPALRVLYMSGHTGRL